MRIGISKMARKTKRQWGVWWLTKKYYQSRTGKKLDYSNPKDINEKSLWLTRYWQNPLKAICADKYLVKEYIKRRGLGHLVVPLIAVYDRAEEIDFNKLPKQFVLKCNHGCGMNIICLDKAKLNIEGTRAQLNEWLTEDWGKKVYEIYYSDIPRKIICEKLLSETAPIEYQVWCINGHADSMLVCRKNFDGTYDSWSYSLDWERLYDRITETEKPAERPQNLEKIIQYALTLSEPFPLLRADFYEVDGKIYLAEMTVTPGGHILDSYKDEFVQRLGDDLRLPHQTWVHPNLTDIKQDYSYMRHFVAAMQKKATEIGMNTATLDDPSGMSFLNTGTVEDLTKLMQSALSSQILKGKWDKQTHHLVYLNRGIRPRRRKLISTIDYSQLLDKRYTILGAKTGSGGGCYNIIMGIEYNGEKYIAVIGNAQSEEQRTALLKHLISRMLLETTNRDIDATILDDCCLALSKITNGEIEYLYTHNQTQVFPLLSTTKVLTIIVSKEHAKYMPDFIRIKDFDTMWEAPEWLKRKSIIRTMDLIYAMLLPSSNISALALARTIGQHI